MRTVVLFLVFANVLVGCSKLSNQEIVGNASKQLTVTSEKNSKEIFVSHIYKDKELGELFLKKSDGSLTQLTNEKQHISTVLLDEKRGGVIYGQSQSDSKIPKILEPIVINSPNRFSEYKIVFYDFNNDSLKVMLDLSSQNIVGVVANMGFLNQGKTLVFQTHYGEIFFWNVDVPKRATKFVPAVHCPNQFRFEDFHNLKTDGNKNLIFDAKSGYTSKTDKSYVYNTFKYNMETHQIDRITNNSFFFNEDSPQE